MMEQTDISDYPAGDADMENNEGSMEDSQVGNEDSQQIADQPEDDKTTSQDEEENDEQANWPMIILLILLLMMMLVYFTYIVRMRMKIYQLNKSFYGSNLNEAAMKLYSYTLKLLHYDGIKKRSGSVYSYEDDLRQKYGTSYTNEFKEVSKINQMAVYSGKDISEEDYQFVVKFKDLTLGKVLKTKNVFQRLKMRLWDFIY